MPDNATLELRKGGLDRGCSIQLSLGGEIAVANLVACMLCPDRRTGTCRRDPASGDYFNSDK
jgi:hypothetical protein